MKTELMKHKPESVNWVETFVTKIHDNPPYENQWLFKIWLPDWLSVWDVFADWERDTLLHMQANLKPNDVLFDVGAENGWLTMIYANFVKPENLVLIEPNPEFWPNIKNTWLRNHPKTPPLHCFYGFLSDKSTSLQVLPKHKWPRQSAGGLLDQVHYRYIYEHGKRIQQITLDDYVKVTGIIPTALNVDVEGAELLILKGGEKTLRDNDMQLWVSIHPDMALRDFGVEANEIFEFMNKLGYDSEFIDTDHEEHWYFSKESK